MTTIDALIGESSLKYAGATALRQKMGGVWRETRYAALWADSGRIAAGLVRRGFKPGGHAAILAPSSPQWVTAYLGVLRAGGVVVPVDKELKSAELRHVLTDCEAKLLFTDPPHVDTILEIFADLPDLESVILLNPESGIGEDDAGPVRAMEALLDEWHTMVSTLAIPAERAARLETLASRVHRLLAGGETEAGEGKALQDIFSSGSVIRKQMEKEGRLFGVEQLAHDAPPPASLRSPFDTAVILYTSGTTGSSKGAMLSHANIVSNIRGAVAHFDLDDSMHTLSFLPINHVFEQVIGILLPLSLGGKISFCESLKKLGENLSEVKPTFLLGVPAVYRMIHDRIMKNIGAKRLSRLLFIIPVTRSLVKAKVRKAFGAGTIFISGGAALDPNVAEGLTSLGLSVYQGYGITETSPVISAEKRKGKRLGTVGLPIEHVEVRIDNPNDEMVGEILVRGPNVMQGYYRNPQATAEVLEDGWYRTGDLGRIDAQGFLSICGRVKNLIVTPNGKNVYPEEVENELQKSPFIAEVMVYGHKVGPVAEEVHALIYADQEALDDHFQKLQKTHMTVCDVEALLKTEVMAACNRLADYKRVRKFTVREDEFPKTTTRKIKRFAVEASISTRE
jgi:long-chain acyl-CoA synthetase